MEYKAKTVEEYISLLPEDRKEAIEKLRCTVRDNLPSALEERILYNMISYVIPHSIYPQGYHVNPDDPLSFISIASQKNHIALYHMGIMVYPDVLDWFVKEYAKYVKTKLDMGKSCIRFKNVKNIPYELIAQLCRKIDYQDYIQKYEAVINRRK